MIDPGNGIHQNIPFEKYLQINRLNNSDLTHIGVSPAHYDHNQTEKRKDTKALRRGRAVSLAIFEPEKFRSSFAVYEDRKAGKEWDKFKAAMGPDVEILKPDEHADVKAIAAAVKASAMAAPYITGGQGEVSICWNQKTPAIAGIEGYDILCKGRLDFVPANVFALADVKTCRSAEPEAFGRQAFQLGYHVAGAWYQNAWKILTGELRPFFLIAVEATAPWVVQVFRMPDVLLELGRRTYSERLDRLVHCRKESRWPGYAESVMELPCPRWALPDDDEIVEEAA